MIQQQGQTTYPSIVDKGTATESIQEDEHSSLPENAALSNHHLSRTNSRHSLDLQQKHQIYPTNPNLTTDQICCQFQNIIEKFRGIPVSENEPITINRKQISQQQILQSSLQSRNVQESLETIASKSFTKESNTTSFKSRDTSNQNLPQKEGLNVLKHENESLRKQLSEARHHYSDEWKAQATVKQAKSQESYEEKISQFESRNRFLENLCETQSYRINDLEAQQQEVETVHIKLQATEEKVRIMREALNEKDIQERPLVSKLKEVRLGDTRSAASPSENNGDKKVINMQLSKQQIEFGSQGDLDIQCQQMEETRQESSNVLKKAAEQIKQANTYKEKLVVYEKQVHELRKVQSSLQHSLDNHVHAITRYKQQVTELEEIISTQQLQIESLSLVNRELQQEQASAASLVSVQSNDSLDSLESLESLYSNNAPSPIEKLEHLWDKQRLHMADIQENQNKLFLRLGKRSTDWVSNIDKLCHSFGMTVPSFYHYDAESEYDDDKLTHNSFYHLFHASSEEMLENFGKCVEATDMDSKGTRFCYQTEDPKLEAFEADWIQRTKEMESIQREQEAVLLRLEGDSSTSANYKMLSLSVSIEEEDTGPLAAKIERQKQSALRALHEDNNRLLKNLRAAEATATGQIQSLKNALAKQTTRTEELDSACLNLVSSNKDLVAENSTLAANVKKLNDVLLESENLCNSQKTWIQKLEHDRRAKARELEKQQSLLGRVAAIVKHQSETMECLRSERDTLEQSLGDHRVRTKEAEALSRFQKSMISGLQGENSALARRLLKTEEEFRSYFTGSVNMNSQISELRSTIAQLVGPTKTSLNVAAEIRPDADDTTTTRGSICDDFEISEDIFSIGSLSSNGGDKEGSLTMEEDKHRKYEPKTSSDALGNDAESRVKSRCKTKLSNGEKYGRGDKIGEGNRAGEELLRLLSFAA